MAAEIGNLFVSVAMNTAAFDKGVANIKRSVDGVGRRISEGGKDVQKFGQAFEKLPLGRFTAGISKLTSSFGALRAAVAGAGVVLAASKLREFARGQAEIAEQTTNLAAAFGISIEKIAELQGVMSLTEGTTEDLETILTRLAKSIPEALTDPSSEAAEAVNALKINMKDLKAAANDPLATLKLLADASDKWLDTNDKANRIMTLTGRSYTKNATLLKNLAGGYEELVAQARKLQPLAADAIRFGNDTATGFDKVKTAMDGLNQALSIVVMPVVRSFNDLLAELINNLTRVATAAVTAVRALSQVQGLSDVGAIAERLFKSLPGTGAIAAVGQSLINKDLGPMVEWWTGRAAAPPGLSATMPGASSEGAKPAIAPLPTPKVGGGGGGRGGRDTAAADAERAAREAERLREEQMRAALAAIDAEQAANDEKYRRERLQIEHAVALEKMTESEGLDAHHQALAAKYLQDEDYYKRKRELAAGDADELRRLDQERNVDYERTLTERVQATFEKTKLGFDHMKASIEQFAGVFENSFTDAFDKLVEGTFTIRDAIGALLKDLGRLMMNMAFQALLKGESAGGVGSGLLGSLGTALGGMFKTSVPANADGGSYRVGGSGGIDSKIAAMRVSPGELIDVRKPGMGGPSAEVIKIDLNPSEGWVSGIADQQIRTRSGAIVQVAVKQSQTVTRRTFSTMATESQARQA